MKINPGTNQRPLREGGAEFRFADLGNTAEGRAEQVVLITQGEKELAVGGSFRAPDGTTDARSIFASTSDEGFVEACAMMIDAATERYQLHPSAIFLYWMLTRNGGQEVNMEDLRRASKEFEGLTQNLKKTTHFPGGGPSVN